MEQMSYLVRWFTHQNSWFSIVMLYQRVFVSFPEALCWSSPNRNEDTIIRSLWPVKVSKNWVWKKSRAPAPKKCQKTSRFGRYSILFGNLSNFGCCHSLVRLDHRWLRRFFLQGRACQWAKLVELTRLTRVYGRYFIDLWFLFTWFKGYHLVHIIWWFGGSAAHRWSSHVRNMLETIQEIWCLILIRTIIVLTLKSHWNHRSGS